MRLAAFPTALLARAHSTENSSDGSMPKRCERVVR